MVAVFFFLDPEFNRYNPPCYYNFTIAWLLQFSTGAGQFTKLLQLTTEKTFMGLTELSTVVPWLSQPDFI